MKLLNNEAASLAGMANASVSAKNFNSNKEASFRPMPNTSADTTVAATNVFSQATFTDQLLTDAQEFTALLKALSVMDQSAYRIASEGANIINPFVVISTLSVDDFVTSDVTEATVGLPSRITLFVTDECAGQLDDVTLTENIPIPETLDFRIDVSFKEISDPQSFQTVSSKFW